MKITVTTRSKKLMNVSADDNIDIAYQLIGSTQSKLLKKLYARRLSEVKHLSPIRISEIIVKEDLHRMRYSKDGISIYRYSNAMA